MSFRFILSLFNSIFVCIIFFSCNSDESVKIKVSNSQLTTPAQTNSSIQILNIEDSLSADSLNIDLRLELASLYYSNDKFDEALNHFLKVYEIDCKNITAITNIGNIYYDTQQFEKAIEYYNKSLQIDNNNINVKCDMATCYLNNKMPEKAIEILKENIKKDFNHAQSHYNLAVIYKQQNNIKESDEEMKIFNSLTPN